MIIQLAQSHDLIVTAEDHSTIGGLGSAVAEIMSLVPHEASLHRIGVESFGESGSPEDLYRHYKLDTEGMIERLQRLGS